LINGKLYAKNSSQQYEASLEIQQDSNTFLIKSEGKIYSGKLQDLKIGERLGNIERKVTLADGSIFATSDNTAIDKLLKQHLDVNTVLHFLETHKMFIVIALMITIVSTFSFFKYGLPFISKKIAYSLPYETNLYISVNTLELLDKILFDETKLSKKRQAKIRNRFQNKLVPLVKTKDDIQYKIHFRAWNDDGKGLPNAFALPSGEIVLTDKFIELAKNSEEIDSVLLHEVGHIVHKHSLDRVINQTFLAVVVALMFGDASGFADAGVGLGSLFVSSYYSRTHESEADVYAFKKMLIAKINPKNFSTIMNHMSEYMDTIATTTTISNEEQQEQKYQILDYLSSHPSTKKRLEVAKKYEQCFSKNLTQCIIE
jgi:Zn-dependent protease with chaperone function